MLMRIAIAALLLASAAPAFAQAWLPAKGEGNVSVLFSNTLSTKHYLPTVAYDRGHIDANSLLFDVTYGVSDRMAHRRSSGRHDSIPRQLSAPADHAG